MLLLKMQWLQRCSLPGFGAGLEGWTQGGSRMPCGRIGFLVRRLCQRTRVCLQTIRICFLRRPPALRDGRQRALADACCRKVHECPLAGGPGYGPGSGLALVHLLPWRNVVASFLGWLREALAIARDSINGGCITYTALSM
jgi:hypothetical protein